MRKEGVTHDHEIEAAVLGHFMIAGAIGYSRVHGLVRREHFDNEGHAIVFDIIEKRFNEGKTIDLMLVTTDLKAIDAFPKVSTDSPAYFTGKVYFLGFTGGNVEEYVMLLHQFLVQRETQKIGTQLSEPDSAARIGLFQTSINQLLQINQVDDWEDVSTVAAKLIDRTDELIANKEGIYLKTGIRFCDRINGGFKRSQFVVIGARPGVGKSVLSGNIASQMAKDGRKVAIINLEMDSEDVLARMLADQSNMEAHRIEQGLLKDEEERRFMLDELNKMATYKIKFSTKTNVNIHDIRAKALKLHSKFGIDLLIIDYLQLVNGALKGANRQEQVADMSRGLKLLSRELNCTVLALAQLNRTGENNISALRESGAIEQDADIVGIIDRSFDVTEINGRKLSEGNILFGKWRNGSTGKQEVYFEGSKMRFICKEDFEERNFNPYPIPEKATFTPSIQPGKLELPGADENLPF